MPQKASAGCLAWSGVHAALEGNNLLNFIISIPKYCVALPAAAMA
jgi:hypothetical protein